jgi:hypothetical protein
LKVRPYQSAKRPARDGLRRTTTIVAAVVAGQVVVVVAAADPAVLRS